MMIVPVEARFGHTSGTNFFTKISFLWNGAEVLEAMSMSPTTKRMRAAKITFQRDWRVLLVNFKEPSLR